MRAARETGSTSRTRSRRPRSIETTPAKRVVDGALHPADDGRPAAVGDRGDRFRRAPVEQGDDVGLGRREGDDVGRFGEVAVDGAHDVPVRLAVRVPGPVDRGGRAPLGEGRRHIQARCAQVEVGDARRVDRLDVPSEALGEAPGRRQHLVAADCLILVAPSPPGAGAGRRRGPHPGSLAATWKPVERSSVRYAPASCVPRSEPCCSPLPSPPPWPARSARRCRRAPQTSCRAIAHIGDSISVGMESPSYLPDEDLRLRARGTRASAPPTFASTSPGPAPWSSTSTASATAPRRPAACATRGSPAAGWWRSERTTPPTSLSARGTATASGSTG